MNEGSPPELDKRKARRSFGRAAADYDGVAVLQHEIGRRMIERFDYMQLNPALIVDIGCGSGLTTAALMQRFPRATTVALDFAMPMLNLARRRGRWLRRPRCLCADLDALPLAAQSADLVFSNAAVQWSSRPAETFADIARVLKPGGLFIFSSFGPDTLCELRAAWAEVDARQHVHAFIDMHDYGDMLMQAGFSDPVMDVERMSLTYAEPLQLMREVKGVGAGNASLRRDRGLTGRTRIAALCAAYERFRDPQGRLPASYEVIHGHAWGGLQRRVDGETRVSLDVLRSKR